MICGSLSSGRGTRLLSVAKRYDEGSPLPDGNLDLVVAAGGDGTVATVAGIASKTSATLAILPLGTANNIATSLGLSAPVPELIASWSTAQRVPFDLGYARAASKEWLVVEGVGGGLVPAGIARAQAEHEHREEHAARRRSRRGRPHISRHARRSRATSVDAGARRPRRCPMNFSSSKCSTFVRSGRTSSSRPDADSVRRLLRRHHWRKDGIARSCSPISRIALKDATRGWRCHVTARGRS